MAGFTRNANRYSKITGYRESAASDDDGGAASQEMMTAILKVSREGYVPEGVTLREWIDDTLFTAEIAPDALNALESDDEVTSVAISKYLHILKSKRATDEKAEDAAEKPDTKESVTKKPVANKAKSGKLDPPLGA